MELKVGLSMNLTDRKAYNIKPDGKPIADGTVSGLRLHPGPPDRPRLAGAAVERAGGKGRARRGLTSLYLPRGSLR